MPETPTATPEELLDLALTAARAAAELVRRRAAEERTVAATKSSDIDVVTQTDRDSEELIRATILGQRPDDSFLGEEGGSVVGSAGSGHGVRWIVDPIDGTVNFLYGLPEYAVSIAAEVTTAAGREVVAGVVINVPHAIEYTAYADPTSPTGVRAARDGRPVVVRAPAPLHQRLIATGFSYTVERRTAQAAAVARLLPQVRDVRRNGAAALELCHVAEGTLDGYVEEGVHPWDYAAGALVARGAGARAELLVGQTGGELMICAPAHGWQELHDVAVAAGFARME